jgi:hypothetical protein
LHGAVGVVGHALALADPLPDPAHHAELAEDDVRDLEGVLVGVAWRGYKRAERDIDLLLAVDRAIGSLSLPDGRRCGDRSRDVAGRPRAEPPVDELR